MWSYIWPILIVIAANTFYNISTKSMPKGVQPFASLTITYLVACLLSVILYFITSENKNLFKEIHKTNCTAIILGCSIVALEFGFVKVYRAGWKISTGSLVANIGLAIVLLIVGILLYKENISLRQIAGMILCIGGIFLINK